MKGQTEQVRYYAECLIPVLDAILKDDKDRIFQFPRCSKTSLRLYNKQSWVYMINQSWIYVINNLDTPDRKYFQLRNNIILKMAQNGVLLTHKHNDTRTTPKL